jgi:hypothetical protein
METRIALPSAMAGALILGIAFSSLVPTAIVGPKAPPRADTWQQQEIGYEPGPTFAFTPAPPIDLDPSRPVGPQYAIGDDMMGYAGPVATISPNDIQAPVYVPVSYDVAAQPRDTANAAPAPQPVANLPDRFDGIY